MTCRKWFYGLNKTGIPGSLSGLFLRGFANLSDWCASVRIRSLVTPYFSMDQKSQGVTGVRKSLRI